MLCYLCDCDTGLEVGFVCLMPLLKSLEFSDVDHTLQNHAFQKVASSGMEAKVLTQSQPRSTLCNKTVIGTKGYNADAATAICNLLGQQLDPLIKNKLSNRFPPCLMGCCTFIVQSKPLHHKCVLQDKHTLQDFAACP